MTLFLRDKNNQTVLDVDFYKNEGALELSAVVCIIPYSRLLLSLDSNMQYEAMVYFEALQELRGWLWETWFMGRRNTADEYDAVLKDLREQLKDVAQKYGLWYTED